MLESGALSDAKFPEWSKNVVLFCHVTSQVTGDKYPKLLSEKGGRGFPMLAILDAAGDVIARHKGERTIDTLEATLKKARAFTDLRAKADGGDAKAKADVEIARLEIDVDLVKFDDARKRIADLGALEADSKKRADTVLADIETIDIMASAAQGRPAAAKRAYEMRKAGRMPSDQISLGYWHLVLDGADAATDAVIYEESLNILKTLTFRKYDDTLKRLKGNKP